MLFSSLYSLYLIRTFLYLSVPFCTLQMLSSSSWIHLGGEIIREKVDEGSLEILGGIYDLETGAVHFLGRSPFHTDVVEKVDLRRSESITLDKIAGS